MKRFQLVFVWTIAASLTLGLAACDDGGGGGDDDMTSDMVDGGGDTQPDTSEPDTSEPDTTPDAEPDATPDAEPDATPDAEPDATPDTDMVTPTCDREGFTSVGETLDADAQVVFISGQTSETEPYDLLSVEFYDVGAGLPISGPGTFPVGANTADQNYATCTTCVLIRTQCAQGAGCAQSFFATGGSIEVTEFDTASGTAVGTLTGATLVEVTIDPNTYESTPVAGGETWCVDSFAFDTGPECSVDADCAGNPNGESCIGGVCTEVAACTINDFVPADESFTPGTASARYTAVSSTAEPQDLLLLEWYDIGNGLPLTGPGAYPLGTTPADQNYATCETCALIGQGCTEAGGCTAYFFAVEGTLNVTALDTATNSITGTLDGATLIEVTVGQGGATTPVAGGASWCLDGYAFDTTAECATDADCTDPAMPFCSDAFECVACTSGFDCTDPAAPACILDPNNDPVCGAVGGACTGDDAGEEGNDGPSGATALTAGVQATGGICSAQAAELDWFTFTLAETSNIELSLGWTDATSDLDLFVIDATGASVVSAAGSDNPEVAAEALVPAGTYFAIVQAYDTSGVGGGSQAVAYTLDLAVTTPECATDTDCVGNVNGEVCDGATGTCVECADSFDCTDPAAPLCSMNACIAVAECTGDDAIENADDGPNGATALTVGAAATSAMICGQPSTPSALESDWYSFTLAATDDITVTLDWVDTNVDLDLYVYDATGTELDGSVFSQPEEIALTGLPAGTYYIEVDAYDTGALAASGYTIAVTAP